MVRKIRKIRFTAVALGFATALAISASFGAEVFGKTITCFILSFWGTAMGLVIYSHALGGKYYFSPYSSNGNWGLLLVLGGFALMFIGPFLATRFFAEHITFIWGTLALYLFGMACGVIMRIGAIEPPEPLSSFSREEQEKIYRQQNGLEPRG